MVYREVQWQNQERSPEAPAATILTVSIDEKPGVQALANTAPDLPPVPGKHPTVSRDHEYKRLGTCSILAGLDLHDGHVTARVERRHRQPGVHRPAARPGRPLSGRMHHPPDPGQSFGAHF